MTWSVRSLLEYSYHPAINGALEGSWAHGDPRELGNLASDTPSSDTSLGSGLG